MSWVEKKVAFLWFGVVVMRFMRVFALRFGVLCWSSCDFGVVGFVFSLCVCVCVCVCFFAINGAKLWEGLCIFMIWNKVVRFVRFYNNEILEFCDFYATFSKIFCESCVFVFLMYVVFVLIYVCVFVDVCCVWECFVFRLFEKV